MAKTALTYADYLKAAFTHQPHVPGLGRMPLHPLVLGAFAVLGLLSPGFWLLGLAAELTYLVSLSTSERFQKIVQAENLATGQGSYETKVAGVLAGLPPLEQERYYKLLGQCREILGLSAALDVHPVIDLRDARTGELNQLLWIFLRLLASRRILDDMLKRASRAELETEIAKSAQRLADEESSSPEDALGEDSALVRSLRGTLEIRRRRLENLDRAFQSRKVIDAELERIAQQVTLVREETAVSGKPELLSSRLDAVTGALSETNRWLETNAEIFADLGADPLGTAPANLPSLASPLERQTEESQ